MVVGVVLIWSMVMALYLPGAMPADAAAALPPGILAMWLEVGPAGVAIARAITTRADCPGVNLGAHVQRMYVRAQPALPDFPVRVCETIIPPETTAAAIEGRSLPLPNTKPQRIAVVGDTGCRLKGEEGQACNDVQAWPFARIAQSAARWQPDLVIHVGDYLYRESPCPTRNAGCSGSPWGDNWRTWNVDFFTPAAELLQAAPWVVTRGNHEICSRGGQGWSRFLDPWPPSVGCQDYTPPYAVPLEAVQLLMLDSASAPDDTAPPPIEAFYAAQFAALRTASGANSWLVTHRPLWGVGQSNRAKEGPSLFQLNATLQAASANDLPPSITLVLSGHVHLFEALSFAAGRPPQLIVGHGGTALDPAITVPFVGTEIAGATVAEGMALDGFGFTTLERSDSGWQATARDVDGTPMARCMIAGGQIACRR
jgi:Calcineurin-like phosphoesterase